MMTCKEGSRLVSESFDQELPLRQRIGVRLHLMMCATCNAYRRQMLLLRRLVKQYGHRAGKALPHEARLSDAAKKRIKKALCQRDIP